MISNDPCEEWRNDDKGHSTIYLKNSCEVHNTRLEFCGKKGIMVPPEHQKRVSDIISPNTTTTLITTTYIKVRKKVMRSLDSRGIQGQRAIKNRQSLTMFERILSNEIVKLLKSTVLLAHPISAILPKCVTDGRAMDGRDWAYNAWSPTRVL